MPQLIDKKDVALDTSYQLLDQGEVELEDTARPSKPVQTIPVEQVDLVPQPEEPSWGETLWRGAVSASYGMAGLVGSAARAYGEIWADPTSDTGFDRYVAHWGEVASEFWRRKAQEVAPQFQGTFMENPSWKRAAGIVMSAMPSLGVASATTIATGGNVVAGAAVLSSLEGAGIYEEARESGKGVAESTAYGAVGGIATYILEKVGLDSIFSKGKTRLLKTAVSGLTEGTTETAQTVIQNMIAKYGYEPTRKVWDGAVESFIGGAGGGMAMSLLVGNEMSPGDRDRLITAASETVANEFESKIPPTRKVVPTDIHKQAAKELNEVDSKLAQARNSAIAARMTGNNDVAASLDQEVRRLEQEMQKNIGILEADGIWAGRGNIEKILKGEEVDADHVDTTLPYIEQKMADALDVAVGPVPVPVGLSMEVVGKPQVEQAEDVQFPAEIEREWQASHGIKPVKLIGSARKILSDFFKASTRVFPLLPSGPRYAHIKLLLTRMPKQRNIAIDGTLRALQSIVKPMEGNRPMMRLFERAVILQDLMGEMEAGRDLPFGFTKETLSDAHGKVMAEVAKSETLRNAIYQRKVFNDAVRAEYVKIMSEIGIEVEFNNENYYRHQVLLYAANKGRAVKSERGVRSPEKRGFLKARKGSKYNINTNYLQAEAEVVAQMLHDIEIARIIKHVDQAHNIMREVVAKRELYRKEHPGEKVKTKDFLPEGYSLWSPKTGSLFSFADSVPNKIADFQLHEKMVELGLAEEEIDQIMEKAGRSIVMALPTELAETLNKPFPDKSGNLIVRADRFVINRIWKPWQLINPRRWFKYNTRNMTGDADAAIMGNWGTFREFPAAVRELYRVFKGDAAMSPMMRLWFKMGGMESNLQVAENMGDLDRLKMFEKFFQQQDQSTFKTLAGLPKTAWVKYWRTARITTDFREALLRYAAFRDYYRQMQENNGRPDNFGGSLRDEVMALPTIEERAFKLSNDLLGAYDEITVTGRAMREHVYPFWSFVEINTRRYWRLFNNAIQDGDTAGMIGRAFAVKVGLRAVNPMTYVRLGKFLALAMAIESMTYGFNNLFFPEEEEELPDEVRAKSHIIFGRKANGDVRYFTRIGLLTDLLSWFEPLEQYRLTLREYTTGKKSLRDIAVDMLKSPFDKVFQGSRPFMKLIGEVASRRSFFPSSFEPRGIRDRGYHIAKAFSLENEYAWLMRLPSKGYMSEMDKFFMYTVNPAESAYGANVDAKNRFMRKINKVGDGFYYSEKGNYLYNFKLALKLSKVDPSNPKPKEDMQYWLDKYIKISGIKSEKELNTALTQSIKRAHPLYGLSDAEKIAYVSQLDGEQRRELVKAFHFWYEVMGGKELGGK